MKYNIGCSGYNYQDWKDIFYPHGLPQNKWLEYYCQYFNTVEINASFYKFPTVKSLRNWYTQTPDDFRFSLKANNIITHYKKFRNAQDQIKEFYDVAEKGLGEKLDCILFQLPPSVDYHRETLHNILRNLNPAFKNVLEFRDASWWNREVYDEMREANAIFCISSFPGLPDHFIKTADSVYMRLHGKTELYKSNYSESELNKWVQNIEESQCNEAFIYFDNTWSGNAIKNAKEVNAMINNMLVPA